MKYGAATTQLNRKTTASRPARTYRRIGPHPPGAPNATIAVETPRPQGGSYYAQASIDGRLSEQALALIFEVLEQELDGFIGGQPEAGDG